MARLTIALLAGVLLSIPASATWTLTQHKSNGTGCTGTSCTVTVTSTGSGHVLIACASQFANPLTITSITNGGTWTHCSNCTTADSNADQGDCSYTLNSTSGATSIVINYTCTSCGTSTTQAEVWELSSTSSFAFDVSGSTGDASCTSCSPQALTLTGSNDAIVQIVTCAQTCTSLGAPYTVDIVNGNGFAVVINASAVGTNKWGQSPAGVADVIGLAIKETGGATKLCTLSLMGAGPC